MVPVGVPPPEVGATTAVKVTGWLKTDDGADEVTDVVVAVRSAETTCVKAGEVLAVKLASPAYRAVTLWLPTPSVLVVNVAVPVPSRAALPRGVMPSWKVTVPVGVPEPGSATVTVAVKVTGWS